MLGNQETLEQKKRRIDHILNKEIIEKIAQSLFTMFSRIEEKSLDELKEE